MHHSRYSDPGKNVHLLQAEALDLSIVCRVAQNTIAHYRTDSVPLPESSNADINARWLSRILDLDQGRHGVPLQHERPEAERVQGCCRDHALLAVSILREHGIPARSRVGFATYLHPNTRTDHVVAEAWTGNRWLRFDPGIPGPRGQVDDPLDIPTGDGSPFLTAAAAWSGFRQSGDSIDDLGVRAGAVDVKAAVRPRLPQSWTSPTASATNFCSGTTGLQCPCQDMPPTWSSATSIGPPPRSKRRVFRRRFSSPHHPGAAQATAAGSGRVVTHCRCV